MGWKPPTARMTLNGGGRMMEMKRGDSSQPIADANMEEGVCFRTKHSTEYIFDKMLDRKNINSK